MESIFIDQATLNGTRPNSPSGVKPARPLGAGGKIGELPFKLRDSLLRRLEFIRFKEAERRVHGQSAISLAPHVTLVTVNAAPGSPSRLTCYKQSFEAHRDKLNLSQVRVVYPTCDSGSCPLCYGGDNGALARFNEAER